MNNVGIISLFQKRIRQCAHLHLFLMSEDHRNLEHHTLTITNLKTLSNAYLMYVQESPETTIY
jgi:hypothetical protein